MQTLAILIIVLFAIFQFGQSANTAFECFQCSGRECLENPKKQSCEYGAQCYKMEVRFNYDVDNPHIIKGCTKGTDETFWKWSCFEDCRENQKVGADKARVCIYCCDDEHCNSATRTSLGVYGIILAFATLIFTLFN